MTTVNNTYNCTQLVLHRVISMAKLYNFDDMTMTAIITSISDKRIDETTIYQPVAEL